MVQLTSYIRLSKTKSSMFGFVSFGRARTFKVNVSWRLFQTWRLRNEQLALALSKPKRVQGRRSPAVLVSLSRSTAIGLRGVRLIISDACIGLAESAAEFFPDATWQRCIVHLYRTPPALSRNHRRFMLQITPFSARPPLEPIQLGAINEGPSRSALAVLCWP
jgi:hypothetical protein